MFSTIAVLAGGLSSEREISLMTGKEVKKALDDLSYKAIEIDVKHDFFKKLKKINPSLAFIALHGSYGEDGCIQGILEFLGIQYTHSKIMASAIAMNKIMSKKIFHLLGIDIPKGYVIKREDILKNNINIKYPYVLKPVNEGSSIGVHVIFSHKDYSNLKCRHNITSANNSKIQDERLVSLSNKMIEKNLLRKLMIIEEYIPGIELQTAVLLDEAIGTIEIRTKNSFFDYKTKYKNGLVEYIFPAEIPENIYKMTLEYALKVHKFLGCRTISRSDFRYNPIDNSLKMLEINTHPGLTKTSLVPKIAKLTREISFTKLIQIIIRDSF